jgi:hypothetical protein
MHYPDVAIPDDRIPRAAAPILQHVLDTYASETNKVAAVWRGFVDADLAFRPHSRSSTVGDILKHQLLSERRFFAEFLGSPEPPAADVVPDPLGVAAAIARFSGLAGARLAFLAAQPEPWWLARVPFFDVERERIWIVWRRILHTAHHRTWDGADPTTTIDAAGRR